MKRNDLILKLKNLGCLNLCAIEIIEAILNSGCTMELMKDIQLKTSLGDINFKKGMRNLLENNILVWIPEKSHRKKALYFGAALIALGAKQVVKSYILQAQKKRSDEIKRANLKNHEEPSARMTMSFTSWVKKGKTYTNPHSEAIYTKDDTIHTSYIENSTQGQRERFMNQYSLGIKTPTAHLYRKAMAKYVPQKVPQI